MKYGAPGASIHCDTAKVAWFKTLDTHGNLCVVYMLLESLWQNIVHSLHVCELNEINLSGHNEASMGMAPSPTARPIGNVEVLVVQEY